MTIAVRAVSSVYVTTNTGTVTLPTGSVAGDWLLLLAGHAFQVNAPAGFDVIQSDNQGNFNAGCFLRQLTSADITTGSVTVTFTGSFNGHIIAVGLTGAITGLRTKIQTFSTTGAASRTITTDGTPLIGEFAIYYAAGRVNAVLTETTGAVLAAANAANSSFIVAGQALAANGSTTDTFGYPTVPTGDYQAIIVLSETASPLAKVVDMQAEVLRNATTVNAQVVDMQAEVLRNASVVNAQVVDIYAEVLRSVTAIVRRRQCALILNGPIQ